MFCAVPASALNLHNGYTVIRNEGQIPVWVFIQHFIPGTIAGAVVQGWTEIGPHSTLVANNCCYAAGSPYRLQVSDSGPNRSRASYHFEPRLCNQHGIPYGFAMFAISAHKVAAHEGHEIRGGRIDGSCPGG